MVALERVRVEWLGMPGGPGVSTFHVNSAAAFLPAIRAFFAAQPSYYPDNVLFHFPTTGDIIESTTGSLVGAWAGPVTLDFAPTGGSAYAAPLGVVMDWITPVILGGRRLRGKTFLVPADSLNFDTNGGVLAARKVVFDNLAATLIAATADNLKVWKRPTPGGSDGGFGTVTQGSLSNKAAVLRSRRD